MRSEILSTNLDAVPLISCIYTYGLVSMDGFHPEYETSQCANGLPLGSASDYNRLSILSML